MGKLRAVIAGTGFGARVQAPGFQALPDYDLAAIFSARPERAEAAARQLGIPQWYTDYGKMLAEIKPEVVSIVTPPNLHAPMTLAACEAGAHVMCEKPLAMNAAEARQMLEMAERLKRVHAIDHEFRFLPARRCQKALVDEGFVGEVRMLEATVFMTARADPQREWNWWADAAQGGGMLGAIASHYIDTFLWLSRSEVVAVSAMLSTFITERPFGGERRTVTADDSCALLLRFANGAQGVIHMSAVAAQPVNRLSVFGSQGCLLVEDDLRLSGGRRGEEIGPINPPGSLVPRGWRDDNILQAPFAHLAQQVLTAIRTGGKVEPNFEDGLRCQIVLDAARVAAAEKRWVEL